VVDVPTQRYAGHYTELQVIRKLYESVKGTCEQLRVEIQDEQELLNQAEADLAFWYRLQGVAQEMRDGRPE
jgi:hypothetical protein